MVNPDTLIKDMKLTPTDRFKEDLRGGNPNKYELGYKMREYY